MNAEVVGFTILLVGIGLVAGKLIRIKVKFFSKYFLPSSVIGGLLFLLLGPEVLGRIWAFEYGVFTESIYNVMGTMPGLLISVIFASLFLGNRIPSLKTIWLSAGPQISFGQTLAWGQYVFGILVTALVLIPFFDAPPMAGALIEIAFEGGHGTASGMADTFAELGYPEGADLALGLATVGVIGGVVIGVILINWGVRHNMTHYLDDSTTFSDAERKGFIEKKNRKASGMITVSPQSIEPLALHAGLIGLAVVIGKGLLEGMILIENALWGANGDLIIIGYVPLFPMAMIGGVIVQVLVDKFDRHDLVDRGTVKGLQGLALDFLILSSIATLALSVIGQNLGVFVTLSLVGIAWNVFVFMFLAHRMIPRNWFERGIGDFGQSMGMTAIGLMLLRIVDSETKTEALEAFGYKQLLFEPLVGGGIVTALSVPMIYNFGMWVVFAVSLVIMSAWLLFGLLYFGRKDASDIPSPDE